jgi:hypothetical protein
LPKNKTGFLDFDDCFGGYAVVLVGGFLKSYPSRAKVGFKKLSTG